MQGSIRLHHQQVTNEGETDVKCDLAIFVCFMCQRISRGRLGSRLLPPGGDDGAGLSQEGSHS